MSIVCWFLIPFNSATKQALGLSYKDVDVFRNHTFKSLLQGCGCVWKWTCLEIWKSYFQISLTRMWMCLEMGVFGNLEIIL